MADQHLPPRWNAEQLRNDLELAIGHFRAERLQEPLEDYLDAFDEYRIHVERLLNATDDLAQLSEHAVDVLTDKRLLEAFRYLAGPPISSDDLKILADAALSPQRLRTDADLVRRVVDVVLLALDRRRFTWISEGREPTPAEREAAVMASAALIAANKTATKRRGTGKSSQEGEVAALLEAIGLTKVAPRPIPTTGHAPEPGEFCGESLLGSRKADFVVTLWDRRLMPIECKVSNSAVNSVKRLNNDAAAKATVWLREFGERQIVPVAVLSGVFKLHNLQAAQAQGLTLFWAHRLPEMGQWIGATRTAT